MTRTRGAGLAFVLVVATSCGGGGGGDGLSDSVENRRRMPSCGAFEASLQEPTAADQAVRDCFLAAFRDGTEKEVTVTATTIEGDPIVTIYRVLGPNDLEVFVDASADKFAGEVNMVHQRCTSVVADGNRLAAGGCVTLA